MSIRGVLFDYRGTLFHDLPNDEWIRSSAALIGRHLDEADVSRISSAITQAESDPEVMARSQNADSSTHLHREAGMYLLERAGLDTHLARAIYERDGHLDASRPYPDTSAVLAGLKSRGLKVAVVSDIHYDLRPIFQHYGLLGFVDAWSFSYVHGAVKPNVRAFEYALAELDLTAEQVVMVGDNPRRDTGGVALGIRTLILPGLSEFGLRGLRLVLGMVDSDEQLA